MRRRTVIGSVLAAGVVVASVMLGALPVAADGGGHKFNVTLSGAAEVPGPGDPDGSGTASLRLNPGQEEVCFVLRVEGIALPLTGAHIHVGAVTEAGPVVVGLAPLDATGSGSGCVAADRDLIRQIIREPSDYYVNVHNAEFPAGALRGQLG
jgi:CHRD domain-containing protein